MYLKRLQNLQAELLKSKLDLFLIEDSINLFYMTGLHLSLGRLLISKESATLFVDGRYFENAKDNSPFTVLPLENKGLEKEVQRLSQEKEILFGFNKELTSFKDFQSLEKEFSPFFIKLIPVDDLTKKLRMIKGKEEINLLSKAALLGSEGYDFTLTLLKEGVTELEIATELEIFWKRKGGKGLAFDPIIAFGKNSSMPHHRASLTSLKKGDTVLIDIGVNVENYHSDMTRTVFFGEPSHPEMIKVYEVVKEAQQKALDFLKPGVLIAEVDRKARNYIEEQGFGSQFNHSLGHGVGLEIHEDPSLRKIPFIPESTLEEGMIVTIEPGVYLPGIGGVRIEDTVLITKNGHINLTLRDKSLKIIK